MQTYSYLLSLSEMNRIQRGCVPCKRFFPAFDELPPRPSPTPLAFTTNRSSFRWAE